MRRRMRMQRSAFVWMGECPFERSVNNQVRIAPDRRSEMRVLIEAKREMSQRIRGVARLLQRAQHQVGDNALLRFAEQLLQQSLVVLRRDAQLLRPGKSNCHRALASVAVRFRASRAGGS